MDFFIRVSGNVTENPLRVGESPGFGTHLQVRFRAGL